MKAVLYDKRSAGDGEHAPEELKAAFTAAGYEVAYRTADHLGDSGAADLIIVAGGDGTVAKIVEAHAPEERPFVIVPLGTANNIATSLGIEGDARSVAAGLAEAEPRTLDICRVSGPWGERAFVEAVGLGVLAASLFAEGVEDLDGAEKVACGREALAKLLAAAQPFDAELEVDGRAIRREALFFEILNLPISGASLPLCPSSDPGDGMADRSRPNTSAAASST